MNKPTTGQKEKPVSLEEMLEFISDIKKMPDWDWEPDSLKILDAIRAALIEHEKLKAKVGEWKEDIKKIWQMTNRFGRERSLVLLAETIRDFGEEK